MLYHEDQQRARWEAKFSAFSADVARLDPATPEQQAVVNNLQANQQRLNAVFADVAANVESAAQTQNTVAEVSRLQVPWSRMAVQTQGMVFDAVRLSQLLRDQSDDLKQRNLILVFAMIGIFTIYFLSNYGLIYRRTLRSIAELQAGTKIIGSGNLDFAIAVNHADEIGELSHAFNRMTANLRTVTASKADLEREIAERQKVEHALRESEKKFRMLFETAPVGISTLDSNRNLIASNAALEKITRMTRTGLTAGAYAQRKYIRPDGTPMPPDEFASVRASKEGQPVYGIETGIVMENGETIWTQVNAAPLSLDGSIVVITQDITESKRADEEIWNLAKFPSENPSPVLRLSSDGTILYANEKSTPVLGHWDCKVGSYAPAYWRRLVAEAYGCQQTRTEDVEVEDRIYSFFIAPIANAGYVNLYARDITDRKRAEERVRKLYQDLQAQAAKLQVANVQLEQNSEELQVANEELHTTNEELNVAKQNLEQQAEELQQINVKLEETLAEEQVAREEAQTGRNILESLMRHAPEVIMIANAPTVNIRMMSRYAEELTGRPLTEFLGVPGATHPFRQDLFSPDLGTPIGFEELPLVRAIRRGEVVLNYEMVLRRSDGAELSILSNAGPIRDPDGKVTGAVATWRDITTRKRTEQQIEKLNRDLERRAVELEIANKELESFSYSVSHDLRTPLAGISGFANIVLNDYGSHLPPDGLQFLELIRNNSNEMNQLVEGLLSFSRFIRQPIRRQTIDLAEMVRQALVDLGPQHQGRQVEIVIGELPLCRADPVLLKQVLINLLSNALKFTRQREVARIEIDSSLTTDGEVLYSVRDNGVGFDSEQAEKLFGVFQRLHSQEDYEGTGVGLAIVERIIRRHGGRVCAEAQVDCGATFYFTVPN